MGRLRTYERRGPEIDWDNSPLLVKALQDCRAQGMTYDEIAKRLKITRSSVAGAVRRHVDMKKGRKGLVPA